MIPSAAVAMTPWSALAVLAAGLGAGTLNAIVGSGSLLTFPTLLALGYPPVLANVSNNVGLVPGSVSAVHAYRRELEGQRSRMLTLGPASLAGGLTGAVVLLALPHSVFKAAVPFLVLAAALLMAVQPRITVWLADRGERHVHGGAPLVIGVYLTGIYGGYFGAAQGVILMSLLAIFIDDDLQRLNGTKNALALLVNTVAGVVFIAVAHIDWSVAALIAVGSVIGGQLGGHYGRRLPTAVLRACVVGVGVSVSLVLFAAWH